MSQRRMIAPEPADASSCQRVRTRLEGHGARALEHRETASDWYVPELRRSVAAGRSENLAVGGERNRAHPPVDSPEIRETSRAATPTSKGFRRRTISGVVNFSSCFD